MNWQLLANVATVFTLGQVAVSLARSIILALRNMTESLNNGAEHIALASSQVASSSQSLAQGASESAASPIKEFAAFLRSQLHGLVQYLLDALPVLAGHGNAVRLI